jgi:hypothetical protein
MFLQRAAVLRELVKGIERLIRRSGKQFAGSPHKIGHGTISKQDTGKQKNRKKNRMLHHRYSRTLRWPMHIADRASVSADVSSSTRA